MKSFKEVVLPDGMLDAAIIIARKSGGYLTINEICDFLQRVIYFKQLSNIYHRDVNDGEGIKIITKKILNNPTDTYFLNKKGHRINQETGSSRSISDIYRICKSYHPDIKLHEVMGVMLYASSCNYCSVVRKLVFSPVYSYMRNPFDRRFQANEITEFSRVFQSRAQYLVIKELDL